MDRGSPIDRFIQDLRDDPSISYIALYQDSMHSSQRMQVLSKRVVIHSSISQMSCISVFSITVFYTYCFCCFPLFLLGSSTRAWRSPRVLWVFDGFRRSRGGDVVCANAAKSTSRLTMSTRINQHLSRPRLFLLLIFPLTKVKKC